MKKLFHKGIEQAEAIALFVQDGWQVFDCCVDGSACAKVEPSAIYDYYERSLQLRGTYPENYLLAVRRSAPVSTGLSAVVDLMLATRCVDLIAIVGYNVSALFYAR